MVRIYKNNGKGGNGEFIIETNASDLDSFRSDLGHAILEVL
jgi:hypothetical protein